MEYILGFFALIIIGAIFNVKNSKQSNYANKHLKTPTRQRKTSAPKSDFQFPAFPYTDNTIVKIKDRTKYKSDFLTPYSHNGEFTEDDFQFALAPYMLEIEVDEFSVMFKKRSTDILGIERLPPGFLNFHEHIIYNEEYKNEEDKEIQQINTPVTKNLLGMGLITGKEIEPTDENLTDYLSGLLAIDLKKLCEKYGFSKSQNKTGLVKSLMQVKEKISIPPIAEPTTKYHALMSLLTKAYISDIEKQLSDKPDDYAAVVWEAVDSEYVDLMPPEDKVLIKARAEKYQHLFNK